MREEHTHFPSKDLPKNMKVWHHFISDRFVPMMYTSKVNKERATLLYGIQKGLKINVDKWINSNIGHTIRQGSGGIPHPTLLTKLIASHGIDTTSQEVLQPKGPLNSKAIKRIVRFEVLQEASGASSSGAWAPHPARPTQTNATITDLARVVECQEAQLYGMRNWMAAEAAYDRSMGEVLRTHLDAISMQVGVDPAVVPHMPPYPEQLTRPWEPEEPPYDEEKEDDDDDKEEVDEYGNLPCVFPEALEIMLYLSLGVLTMLVSSALFCLHFFLVYAILIFNFLVLVVVTFFFYNLETIFIFIDVIWFLFVMCYFLST